MFSANALPPQKELLRRSSREKKRSAKVIRLSGMSSQTREREGGEGSRKI